MNYQRKYATLVLSGGVLVTAGYLGQLPRIALFSLAMPHQTNYHGAAADRYS